MYHETNFHWLIISWIQINSLSWNRGSCACYVSDITWRESIFQKSLWEMRIFEFEWIEEWHNNENENKGNKYSVSEHVCCSHTSDNRFVINENIQARVYPAKLTTIFGMNFSQWSSFFAWFTTHNAFIGIKWAIGGTNRIIIVGTIWTLASGLTVWLRHDTNRSIITLDDITGIFGCITSRDCVNR